MEPIYLEDSYIKEFDAIITAVQDNRIELNRTAFYPESGGQLGDKGILIINGKKHNVMNTKKEQGRIFHYLEFIDNLKVNDKVKGIIDWNLRYKMMRMHTAAHILSAIINKETKAMITGNQLGYEKSRIDFDLENFDKEMFKIFIEKANEEIIKEQEVVSYIISRKDAEKKPELCRLAKGLPESIQEIRIVKIGNIDEQADGGTHVKNTREIGKIILVGMENKGKNNRRIYFSVEP